MKMPPRRLAMTVIALCLMAGGRPASSFSYAATEEVTVTARAFPEKLTLGDEIHFLIQVERPKKYTVQAPSRHAKLSPFEIKAVETSPIVRGKNRIRETFTLTLTVFKLGDLVIPPVPVEILDADGRSDIALTDPVHVQVVSVGKKTTDKDDIRTIKGPVSFNFSAAGAWLMGFLAAALAIFLTVKVILRRRKKIADLESLMPPHERAYLELERLRAKGFLEERKIKEFYSELSDIFRRYLERSFGIAALDGTTREIIAALKQKDFSSVLLGKAKELLENSDLVKFAKFDPPRSLAQNLETRLVEIVEATRPEEKKTDENK